MSFLGTETLQLVLPGLVRPFAPERIECGAYELGLGCEYFITTDECKKTLAVGAQLVIPPGQLALLISAESVSVPCNMMAFISIKSTMKLGGLISVSGFHVDPGFVGHLKFTVYNAGSQPTILDVGQPLFLIWYAMLDAPTLYTYKGKSQNQNEITAEDVKRLRGAVLSPPELNKKIETTQREVEHLKWRFNTVVRVFEALFVLFLGAAVIGLASHFLLQWLEPNHAHSLGNPVPASAGLANYAAGKSSPLPPPITPPEAGPPKDMNASPRGGDQSPEQTLYKASGDPDRSGGNPRSSSAKGTQTKK
jgi:dCTP deaminase